METQMKKPLTVKEQLDMDLLAEAELSRLERQYRIMEGDRKTFNDETSKKLKMQRKTIIFLKHEKNRILNDLTVATSDMNKKKDREITQRIQFLLNQSDNYVEDFKKEARNLKELDVQIKKLEKDLQRLRLLQVTEKQCQEKIYSGHKTIQMLENRLETLVKKFCCTLYDNRILREEINSRLLERVKFKTAWQRLMDSLSLGKKCMLELIEHANIAYDQREEWCIKLRNLRSRIQSENLVHIENIRELQRKLDHDSKLETFLSTKGQRRILKDLEEKEAKKRELAKQEMMNQLESYKEILSSIKKFSGEENVQRLAAQYVKQEEENFALFNYVNELNHELEKLTDIIADLRLSIDEQKEINVKKMENQKNDVEKLQETLNRENEKTESIKEKLLSERKILDQVLCIIEDIFKKIGCDSAPVLDILGGNKNINYYNVTVYLGLIDGKVNDMIADVYFKENGDYLFENKSKLLKGVNSISCFSYTPIEKMVPANPCPLCSDKGVDRVFNTLEKTDALVPLTRKEITETLKKQDDIDFLNSMHDCSDCFSTDARQVLLRRHRNTIEDVGVTGKLL